MADNPSGAVTGAETAASPARPADGAWPSLGRSYYTLFVLTIGLTFSLLDRQVLTLMIQPVKEDLHLSDTEVGLLIGIAFVSMYAVLGIPIARIADRWSRRNIIALGIAFWSVMTMLCGLAQSYVQLFIARMGVGAGESSFSPSSYSILTDSFPREKLAKALGLFNIGSTGGAGLALIIGGAVLGLVATMPDVQVPGIGVMRPWQWAFIAVGAPGILWALLVRFTVKEPVRRGLIQRAGEKPKTLPISQVFKYLFDDWRCFAPIFLAMAVKSLLSVGAGQWGAAFFYRTHGWSGAKYGMINGTMILILAPLGLVLGGMLAERWAKKGMWDCNMRIVLYATILIFPTSVLYPLMPSPWLSLALMGFNIFIASLGIGPGNAALQLITPNQMRSQVNAFFLFVLNVVGFGISPLFVALFTDYIFGNEADLKYSIALLALILSPISIVVTWYGVKPYGRSAKRAAEQFA